MLPHLQDADRSRPANYAEALAIYKLHGLDAPRGVAERIGALAQANDAAGVKQFHEIATSFEHLLIARRREQ